MSADTRTLRSFAGLAVGEAIARGLAFAAMLIVARRLGPSMYGVIGVASGIMLYLNQVADGGIELSGVPAVARRREGLDDLVSSALTVRVVVAFLLAMIVVAIGVTVFPQPDGAILALYAVGLLFVAVGARWVFVGLQRTTWVAGARIAGELTALVIIVAAVRDVGDVALVPIAVVTGAGIAAALMLIGLSRLDVHARVLRDREKSRELFARGPHLVGFTLLGLVLFNADLIYLRVVSGQAAAGYYNAAYTFIAFAANLSITWAQSIMPALARYDATDPRRNAVYETSMLLAFAVALPVAVGGMLTASPLIDLIFGSQYMAAAPALIWLLPALPISALREIAVVGLIGTPGGERRLIRVNAICAAFNVGILIPVVPVYGLVGAAAVTTLTEVLRLVLAFRFASEAGYRPPAMIRFIKPTFAAAVLTLLVLLMGQRPLWQSVAAGVTAYLATLLVTGAIRIQKPFQVRVVV